MIIRLKDAVKLFGVFIMCACAVFVCTLFLNFNMDTARIEAQITNPQIKIFYDTQVLSGKVTSAVSGGALLLTTVVMLLFYIKHYIDTHASELGILKALGYANFSIAKHFWVFGLSVFVGTGAGFCSSFALMPAFYNQMNSDGILPETPLHFNPILVLYLIVLPTMVFSILSVIYAYYKLKRPALMLIRGENKPAGVRKKKRTGNSDSRSPFLRDLKHSTVRSRFSLVFLIAFSSFCYSSMTQMSFSMTELSSQMMAAMMIGIGLVLAFTTLFLAVTTVIRGNAKTISMLRVFGYTNRECGDAILNGYRPTAYIGFIVGTVYQYILLKSMVSLFFTQSVVEVPDYNFNGIACIISLISFVLIYETIMFIYTRTIKQMPLKEIMQEE